MSDVSVNDDILESWEEMIERMYDVLDSLEDAGVHELPAYPGTVPSFDELLSDFVTVRDELRELRREAGA